MPADITVLYVAGAGRSGSTLLDTLLGQLDGFFSAGELGGLWGRGLIEGYLCGCGLPVRTCPLWTEVIAAGAPGASEAPAIVQLQAQVLRTRHIGRVMRAGAVPTGWEPLDRYAKAVGSLYRSIASVAGARVIVDSSKRPTAAAVAATVPGIRPALVHLVRDPRAVAWSWRRHKALPEGAGAMPTRPVWHSTRSWLSANLTTEVVAARRYQGAAVRVRYEDLVTDTHAVLRDISALAGESAPDLSFLADGEATLAPTHTVSGNPSRFDTGLIRMRLDDEWRSSLPRRDRRAVGAVTAALRARYGYVGR